MSATDKRTRKYQSNHMRCCFWFWSEGRIAQTQRKASQSKAGNEQTHIKYGVEAGIKPRPHWWQTNAHAIMPTML